MQPQQNFSGSGQGPADQTGAIVCPQCGSPMPREMRFCRSCGNRLGEGPAEYTETVRLPHATAPANGRATTPFVPGIGAPFMQPTASALPCVRRRRFRGLTWMWIALAIFFVSGGSLSTFVSRHGRNIPRAMRAAATTNRSYFGVNEFTSANDGVTFEVVEPPGSPGDKAGLVGGDIITSFDGHAVDDEDEMMNLLQQTPIGKTVEVVYLRDGEMKQTQLTTISFAEYSQLERAFRNRPEGQGRMGFDDSIAKVVPIPGTNISGVQLRGILPNRPADLAGLKPADIVIEFDGVPIRTVAELTSRVHRTAPYSTIELVVMRDGQRLKIPVKFGKGE